MSLCAALDSNTAISPGGRRASALRRTCACPTASDAMSVLSRATQSRTSNKRRSLVRIENQLPNLIPTHSFLLTLCPQKRCTDWRPQNRTLAVTFLRFPTNEWTKAERLKNAESGQQRSQVCDAPAGRAFSKRRSFEARSWQFPCDE